jgi:hypothetical protein
MRLLYFNAGGSGDHLFRVLHNNITLHPHSDYVHFDSYSLDLPEQSIWDTIQFEVFQV